MKYLHEIIWYLTLPMSVVVSYYSVKWGLKVFHKKLAQEPGDIEKSDE